MVAKSPDRGTFQQNSYVKRCKKEGKLPSAEYLEMFKTWREQEEENLKNPEWQKDNLEYDLRSTPWICDKVKASDVYAQNLYAAMCNMQFQKLDVISILKNKRWSCSWRSSGGIVANMKEKGDYIDWYCSGISNSKDGNIKGYVPEGHVTEEIENDLKKLGWVPLEWEDDE